MALDLYPNEDVSSLIDIETIEENGSAKSREKIGRLALSLLLEKSRIRALIIFILHSRHWHAWTSEGICKQC